MKKRHVITIPGYAYYQKELKELLTDENVMWSITKKEAIEDYSMDEDEKIYRYETEECIFGIKHEPDNQYDPAAIKVFADGHFIGYMPRGHIQELKRLIVPGVSVWVEIYGGPYKYLEHDDDEDYLGTYEPKYYKFVKEDSPVKAAIIFEWK